MRRTAAAICLLLAGTLAGCSSGKSEAEVQKECQAALTAEATKTSRPDACEDLSQEDYDTLLMAWVLRQQGVVDENGDVDMGKLLDGATSQP